MRPTKSPLSACRVLLVHLAAAAACIAACSAVSAQAKPEEPSGPEQLLTSAVKRWDGLRTYAARVRASFSMESTSASMTRRRFFDVEIAFPNRFSIREQKSPTPVTVVCDGKTLWTYSAGIERYREEKAPGSFQEYLAHAHGPGGAGMNEGIDAILKPFSLFGPFLPDPRADAMRAYRVRGVLEDKGGEMRIEADAPGLEAPIDVTLSRRGPTIHEVSTDVSGAMFGGAAPPALGEVKMTASEIHDDVRWNETVNDDVFQFIPPPEATREGGEPEATEAAAFKLSVLQVKTPEPRELVPGKPASGSLTSSAPYEVWAFKSERKGKLRVALDSQDEVVTLLQLADPEDVLEDALALDGSMLFVDVAAGARCYVAVALRPDQTSGDYSFRAEWHDPPAAAEPRPIRLAERRESFLTWRSAERPNGVPFDVWTLEIASPALLAVDARSSEFDPVLRVFRDGRKLPIARNDDLGHGADQRDASLLLAAEKGVTYRIEVSSREARARGRYEVEVSLARPPEEPPPPAGEIHLGSVIEGKMAPHGGSSAWKLSVEKPARALLYAAPQGFEPRLSLRTHAASTPASTSAGSEGGPLSLIVDLLPGVPYFITLESTADEEAPQEAQEAGDPLASAVGQAAPPVAFKDLEGKDITLEAAKGKVVLLDFWATWCPPCVREIPGLLEIQEKYRDKVMLLAASSEPLKLLRDFRDARAMKLPIVRPPRDLAEPFASVGSLPTTFLIDGAGVIRAYHVGFTEKDVLAEEIDKLLAEK